VTRHLYCRYRIESQRGNEGGGALEGASLPWCWMAADVEGIELLARAPDAARSWPAGLARLVGSGSTAQVGPHLSVCVTCVAYGSGGVTTAV
jgi:hypothetical protein